MNQLKIFLFSLSLICTLAGNAQKTNATVINDFVVTIHEETVNKILAAVGDISGTNDYEVMLIKGKYHWTIKNPKIAIRPDSSNFFCDAIVKCGPFDYKTPVVGDVKISYDPVKNLIYIKITRAIFELYTMVFNKKIHIKDIHLEDYFKEPFTFEGPQTLQTDMDFSMPDSAVKKVYIKPTDCKMDVKWKEICTSCEMAASDKPFKPVVKPGSPANGVNAITASGTSTVKAVGTSNQSTKTSTANPIKSTTVAPTTTNSTKVK
jgi:hypothetical protein